MLRPKAEYKLEGAFRVKLFDKDHNLIDDSEFFDNFITPTGLSHVLRYPFADCFRFLSLGTSSAQSRGEQASLINQTTGLGAPISSINCSDGTSQPAKYLGYESYAGGEEGQNFGVAGNAGGTVVGKNQTIMFRSWQIPASGKLISTSYGGTGLSINEFMVSPFSPNITGVGGQCIDPLGVTAFSRVVRPTIILDETYAVITYQLKINFQNTGRNYFGPGTFETGDADIEDDAALVSLWAQQSGYYTQCYHGLQCVDSHGASYLPVYGDLMEPSNQAFTGTRQVWYISPDNYQFCVNTSGQTIPAVGKGVFGGKQTDEDLAYKADGLYSYRYGFEMGDGIAHEVDYYVEPRDVFQKVFERPATGAQATDAFNSNLPLVGADNEDRLYKELLPNIRLNTNYTSDGNLMAHTYIIEANGVGLPNLSEYDVGTSIGYHKTQIPDTSEISYATPGVDGYDDDIVRLNEKAIFATRSLRLPFDTGNLTGRSRSVSRRSSFLPSNSRGWNSRFGSMVYAYRQGNEQDIRLFPSIDVLFIDDSGRFLPQHYRRITGLCLTDRGQGVAEAYFYTEPTGMCYPQTVNPNCPDGMCDRWTVKTINGPYNADGLKHPALDGIINIYNLNMSEGSPAEYCGCSTGEEVEGISPDVVGSTGTLIVKGFTGYDGWGAVYGFYDTEDPYYGIAPHNIQNLTKPSRTGPIYWQLEPPFGQELVLKVSGIKYYHPNVGLVDENYSNMVLDLDFQGKEVSTGAYTTDLSVTDYELFNSRLSSGLVVVTTGTHHLYGEYAASGTGLTSLFNSMTGVTNPVVTGWLFKDANQVNILGTDFNGTAPTDRIQATVYLLKTEFIVPSATGMTLGTTTYDPGGTLWGGNAFFNQCEDEMITFRRITGYRVTGIFANFAERGSGVGWINSATTIDFIFSGKNNNGGGEKLYLTYLDAPESGMCTGSTIEYRSPSSWRLPAAGYGTPYEAGGPWTVSALGDIYATTIRSNISTFSNTFRPPTGYLIHEEAYKLLPLHGLPKTSSSPSYTEPEVGGAYPGLSFDNGMDVFLDITWSAGCGGATDCA